MGSAAATPPRHLRSTCGGGRIARHSAVRTVGECTKRSRWPGDRRQRHAIEAITAPHQVHLSSPHANAVEHGWRAVEAGPLIKRKATPAQHTHDAVSDLLNLSEDTAQMSWMPLSRHTGKFPRIGGNVSGITPDFLIYCEQLQREQAEVLQRNVIEHERLAHASAFAKQEVLTLNARVASLYNETLKAAETIGDIEAAVAFTTNQLLTLNTEREGTEKRLNTLQSVHRQMLAASEGGVHHHVQ